MYRITMILVVAALAFPSGCSASNGHQRASKLMRKPAPDFELVALDGARVRLSELRGKSVLLAFFAVDCPPCRMEAPSLSAMAQKYAKDGLVVLAVNMWDEDKATVEKFAADKKLQHRILLNGSSVGELYEVTGIPMCFWINRAGIVVDSHVNFDGVETLERKTKKLLAGG